MACDAATLEALAVLDKNPALSDRDLLICWASVLGTNAGYANAQVALNAAYTNKYARLSDADLEKATLAVMCS